MTVSSTGIQYDGHHPFYTERRVLTILKAVFRKEYRNNGTVLKTSGGFPWKHRLEIFAAEGHPNLPAYIYRKWGQQGGFEYFARQLGVPVRKVYVSRQSLQNPERLRQAYLRVKERAMYDRETGEMIKAPGVEPSVEHFRRASTLAVAVYNAVRDLGDGSLNKGRKKLRLEERKLGHPKWVEWQAFAAKIQELKDNPLYHKKTKKKIKDVGAVPSGPQLIASGNSGLYKAAFKYHGGFDESKKRLGWLAIQDAPSFMEFLDTHERARELVGLFYTKDHLADLALARALAAAFPSNFTGRSDFIDAEKLRSYKTAQPTLEQVTKHADVASKDELLRDILLNMARDATFGVLGENPTEKQIISVYSMVREREREEKNPKLLWLLTNVRQEFDAFMDIRSRYRDFIRVAKEQDPTFQPYDLTFGQFYGAFSSHWRGRMLYADVAGYGKTSQEVAAKVIRQIYHGKVPTVVFGPNSSKEVWRAEVRKNLPNPNILIVNSYDPETLSAIGQQDVAVLNYDSLSSPHTRRAVTRVLSSMKKLEIALDESQLLKGSRTTRYRMGRPILDRATNVSLISFTPFDSLSDAYVAISILEPDKYPTPEHARRAFVKDPLVLHAVLSRHMTRRDVEDLPSVEGVPVKLSEPELEAYSQILDISDPRQAPRKLDQLRKAVINPALVDGMFLHSETLWKELQKTAPAKFLAVDRILETMEPNDKAIIFSSYLRRGVMDRLENRLSAYGALRIDGTVPYGYGNRLNQRGERRQWWLTFDTNRVLIMNDVGEASWSLVYPEGKTYLIFLDWPTSVIEYVQTITRIARRGHKNFALFGLVAEYPNHPLGSIDRGNVELIDGKLDANRIVLDGASLTEDGRHILSGVALYKQRPVAARLWTPEQMEARRLQRVA